MSIVDVRINWPQLMSVCSSRMFTDHFEHPEDYGYDEHCDSTNCECKEEGCPVWTRWILQQQPTEVEVAG